METESLINKIQKEVITYLWANGAEAKFEYEKDQIAYRLIRVNYDSNSFLIRPQERNDTNCPILATGFVAFLIRNWGKSEQWIFDKYYNNCLNKYKQAEQKKPGSSMRNLDAEFYPTHVKQEKEFVTFSENIFPYLSSDEIELINQFIKAYFKYIKQAFAYKEESQHIPIQNELNKALPPQPIKNESKQKQLTFINNFDDIQPIEVYNHFKTNLVEKGYLTEQELNEYLKHAFELQTIPKNLFKLKNTPIKQKIYTVFYTYYKDIAGKKHKQQAKYVDLLGNYFEGYTSHTIKTNWSKGYKPKR